MERLTTTHELVEAARPYLELQSDLLNTIARGIDQLLKDTDLDLVGVNGLVRMAAYHAQLQEIRWEMIQRN